MSPQRLSKAFSYKGFRYYWLSSMCATLATQIISVAVGWQIYDITRDPLYLGYVGLVQFLPSIALMLVTGWAADQFSRRFIMGLCILLEAGLGVVLVLLADTGESGVLLILAVLTGFGFARAFYSPARQSLAPNLVPREALANALALTSSAWQMAMILGPVAGGLLYGISGQAAYGVAVILLVASLGVLALIPKPERDPSARRRTTMKTLLEGFTFVWNKKLILGSISLDLFAVLLGGATALLPVYARDILDVGPWGLGLLRAAPGIGAIGAAIILSQIPIKRHAGVLLFGFVALFGLFTALFGISTSVVWSIVFLALVGATDMVSVVIRDTLIQLWTPDEVRGRVSAVNSVFVGASNELGEFRAGVMAAFTGAKIAVVAGGVGAVAIAGLWAAIFPELRKAQSLQDGAD